jgi:AI-2 transport protein TqsA
VINVNVSTATRWGMNAVILLSIVIALYLGQTIFIPTVISLLLAAMLWPTATWLNQSGVPVPWLTFHRRFPWTLPALARMRISWGLACLTVVTGFILLVLLMVSAFGFGMSKIVIDIGNYEKQKEVYSQFRYKLDNLSPVPLDEEYFPPDADKSKVFISVQGFLSPTSLPFLNLIQRALIFSGSVLWQSVLVMFILLFMLLEGRMLSRRFVEIFGTGAHIQGRAVEALKDIAYQIRAYLVWRTIINFAVAGFLGIIYHILGLKLPWTWALLTAVLWYIPYLGAIAAGVPPLIDAFVSAPAWVSVFILVFYTMVVVIEGYIIVPVVMGRSMEMNATTVMLACLFWELVWGSPGLFLAMPLMAALKSVCHHVPEWRPWANLMSSHDEIPAEKEPPPISVGLDRKDTDTRAVTASHEGQPVSKP